MTPIRAVVFGPAYLDRVLVVDRPLAESGRAVDRSVKGRGPFRPAEDVGAAELLLRGVPDFDLLVAPTPPGWPGPFGSLTCEAETAEAPRRVVAGVSWREDLGGMGAGYAKAFGARLVWPAGDPDDPVVRAVAGLLDREGIDHRPLHTPDRRGEWTLLVSSGAFGDKLAVGLRFLGGVAFDLSADGAEPCDLLVAASMSNRRAAEALAEREARVKFFAPSLGNATDADPPISRFAKHIDVLSCNALEWDSIEDREEVAWRVSLLVVTDGPRGATVRFTDETGDARRIVVPAFPRSRPPRDTNRAGEAFGATLISTLMARDWSPSVCDPDLVKLAAERASAAAALVLDRTDFGFPSDSEIDEALRRGVVD